MAEEKQRTQQPFFEIGDKRYNDGEDVRKSYESKLCC